MELKTKVHAEDGRQDYTISRDFDLPVKLLFSAYENAELAAQWMGTKILKQESKKHGSYQYETTNVQGNIVFQANGVIHDFIKDRKIVRTFEMGNTPFGVQLEIYEFEPISDERSRLRMHVIYETATQRDQVLKLPFAQGLNLAHNRIQEILNKLK